MIPEILRAEFLSVHDADQHLLRSVSFTLAQGELTAVVSNLHEKQSLAAIFSGQLTPEQGRLLLQDQPAPTELHSAGLFFVGQESHIFPTMTVAHNFFLYTRRALSPDPLLSSIFLHDTQSSTQTAAILNEFALTHIAPDMYASRLSSFDRSLLEIVFYASIGAKIIVLDDLLSTASKSDRASLTHILHVLQQKNIAVLYLSSKFDVLFEQFQRLSIIYNGVTVKELRGKEINRSAFMRHMSFYELPHFSLSADSMSPPNLLLNAQDVHISTNCSIPNFHIDTGEILGICDPDWKFGITLSDILSGHTPFSGTITLKGIPYCPLCMKDAIQQGIALSVNTHVQDPIYPDMSLYDNVTLLADAIITGRTSIIKKRLRRHVAEHALHLIEADSLITQYAGKSNLHGIHSIDQLRVNIAKWLCIHPKLLILVNPFSVLDDRTIPEFQNILLCLKKIDVSVLILSMNQQALYTVCDRVLTFN